MEQKPVISGLICEFNPLHFGHAFLLSHMRKQSDVVICAMSGPFVQRGEAALLSPWARAEMALWQGADLVLMLPVSFAMSGAERFARGGVSLLTGVGVNTLYFGSECGHADKLDELASFLLSHFFLSFASFFSPGAFLCHRQNQGCSAGIGRRYGSFFTGS